MVQSSSSAHADGPDASALGEDSARYAASNGQSETQALEESEYQDGVNLLMDPLIDEYYSSYAEAGFDGPQSAYIIFKGEVPQDVTRALADRPDIRVQGGAQLSLSEADELATTVASEIFDGVSDSGGDAEGVTIRVDAVSAEVEVVAGSDVADAGGADFEAKVEAAAENGSPDSVDPSVVIVEDSTLEVADDAVRGGDKLTLLNSSGIECTAAFPAKSGSTVGLLTAGHCKNTLSVDGGNKLYPATKILSGSKGDSQWHRSKVSVTPYFRYDWGSYRPVWGHPAPKVGAKVCRFGATSGNGTGCTKIKYVSACKGDVCKMVMTEGDTGRKPGDSGGPWYYGNNAYGIHNGASVRDGKTRNWFTSSRYAMSQTGLTAMIGPR